MGHFTYDELEWHLGRLRQAAEAGRLVFLLGAGVSAGYGLPDWQRLLVRLMHDTGRIQLQRTDVHTVRRVGAILNDVIVDPLLQAQAARNAFEHPGRWTTALKEHLVAAAAPTRPGGPLALIARAVADQYRAGRDRHIAVLTFNYDNLLEQALEAEEDVAQAVHPITTAQEMGLAETRPGIFVYHLHGSIARPGESVILDAASYAGLLAAPANHWSWQCMHRFLFGDAGVMLIGLSLLDPSLRLLLTRAAADGRALSAVFVTKPFPRIAEWDDPAVAEPAVKLSLERDLAGFARDVQTLFDEALESLQLVPYHVGDWGEIQEILERVRPRDRQRTTRRKAVRLP